MNSRITFCFFKRRLHHAAGTREGDIKTAHAMHSCSGNLFHCHASFNLIGIKISLSAYHVNRFNEMSCIFVFSQ